MDKGREASKYEYNRLIDENDDFEKNSTMKEDDQYKGSSSLHGITDSETQSTSSKQTNDLNHSKENVQTKEHQPSSSTSSSTSNSQQRSSKRKRSALPTNSNFIKDFLQKSSITENLNKDTRILKFLQLVKDQSEEQLKKISSSNTNPLIKAWNEGPLQIFLAWLLWLFIGTVFYANVNFQGSYSKGFYYTVNVGYSIGWGVLHDKTTGCKLFSILYVLIGALFVSRWLSYLLENAIDDKENDSSGNSAYNKYQLRKRLEQNNPFSKYRILSNMYVYCVLNSGSLLVIYLWCLYILVGMSWSVGQIDWSLVDGLYFAVSSLSTGGLWGIPEDSPDSSFLIVGLYAATGVPLMGMAMAHLAALIMEQRRQKIDEETFSKLHINKQEKLLLDIIQMDKERDYIDRNEFLLFHLMKRKMINLALIQEIYDEFDHLDCNATGILTYSDLAQRSQGLTASKIAGDTKREEVINQLHVNRSQVHDDENDVIK